MKTRILMIAALVVTTITFAQKKEIKTLEKAVKSGKYANAKALIGPAEALLSAMDTKTKEKFLLLKAQAFLGSNNTNIEDLKNAGKAFNMLKNSNLSGQAATGLTQVVTAMVNNAVEDQDASKYQEAGLKLQDAYEFSNENKDYLFYAASNFLNAKSYDRASTLFQGLLDNGYKGQVELFYAVNAKTGEQKEFSSKKERDILLLSKEYIKPTQGLSESREEIITNYLIAIYTQEGNSEKALTLLNTAIAKDPKNSKLLLSKANIFFKMNKTDKYKETIAQVLELDPNNAELTFNLGVSEQNLGNMANAKTYYEKAISIDPTYSLAYNNLASLVLEQDRAIADEMNALGTSNADYKRYDTLKVKRVELWNVAKSHLQNALKYNPEFLNAARTLYDLHNFLDETSQANVVKAKIDAMQKQ